MTDRFVAKGHRVVVVDNLSSGQKRNINPKAKFYKADVTSGKLSAIFEKEKPDTVFHFAAHIEARVSVQDPVADAQINIIGTLHVLEQCRKYKVKKVLFASSGGEVYGAAEKIPTPETYPPRPLSPYGVAKLSVEHYLDAYHRLFGLSYAALRYGNVYGPRQNPKGEAGIVAIFADKMLSGEQVFIHGDGKQTKDYIFIDDAVEATMLAFEKDFIGVMNIGTGKEASILEIFRAIKKLTRSSIHDKHITPPLGGFPRGCLSISKAKKKLGWRPRIALKEGLERTVKWFALQEKHEE